MKFQSSIVASLGLMLVSVAAVSFAQDVRTNYDISPVLPVANPCPRFNAGSVVHNPPALFSSNGVLQVRFSYQHRFDSDGTELLCFMTPGGLEDPTLHMNAGVESAQLWEPTTNEILDQHSLSRNQHFARLSPGQCNQNGHKLRRNFSVQPCLSVGRTFRTLLVPPSHPHAR